MFLLDSLLVSGLRWTLDTIRTAADAELNDESALREQLLAAGLRHEQGEIDDDAFRATEAELLARLREIRDRRGGDQPLTFETSDSPSSSDRLEVQATVAGDFHDTSSADAGAAHGPRDVRRAPQSRRPRRPGAAGRRTP
jgi:hypothetical protein